MQRCATWLEAARPALLGVVVAVDQPHELGHAVAVEVGRAERVLSARVPRREDDEVGGGNARLVGRHGEHGEDRGVRVVDPHAVDWVKPVQVIFERDVIAVPAHHVEDRVRTPGAEELPQVLAPEREVTGAVLEPRVRVHKVARLGQAVCADGAEVRKSEVATEALEHVPPAAGRFSPPAARLSRLGGGANGEPHVARDHAHLARFHAQLAELSRQSQRAQLGHDQKVAIRVVQGAIRHGSVERVHMDRDAVLGGWAPGTAHRHQTLHEGDRVFGGWEGRRPPAQRVRVGDRRFTPKVDLEPARHRLRRARAHRGSDTVQPRPLVGCARAGEGGPRELLRVQAERRRLRRVLPDR
mmetsp:Transcript_5598/g.18680  ORF Transcript_5598/g.18680 Transcript_5598/m.18680 type:complete len:355 (+) Transcript_5598:560-1624(+)